MDYLSNINYSHLYWIFLLPFIFCVADILTGLIQAHINNCYDSTKMRKGLFRKAGELMVVFLAYITGVAIPLEFNVAVFFSLYIVIMEIISVMENLDLAGVPMPTWITKKLKKVADGLDDGEEIHANEDKITKDF